MVGGVTPGKGGTEIDGFPVFSCHDAVRKTGANTTMIFGPPPFCADAILWKRRTRTSSLSPSLKGFRSSIWCGSRRC